MTDVMEKREQYTAMTRADLEQRCASLDHKCWEQDKQLEVAAERKKQAVARARNPKWFQKVKQFNKELKDRVIEVEGRCDVLLLSNRGLRRTVRGYKFHRQLMRMGKTIRRMGKALLSVATFRWLRNRD